MFGYTNPTLPTLHSYSQDTCAIHLKAILIFKIFRVWSLQNETQLYVCIQIVFISQQSVIEYKQYMNSQEKPRKHFCTENDESILCCCILIGPPNVDAGVAKAIPLHFYILPHASFFHLIAGSTRASASTWPQLEVGRVPPHQGDGETDCGRC